MFGSILGAVGSIGGALIGANSSRSNAARAQAFEERMANTAIQRQVQDIKEAGMNPAMIYEHGGSGAPMPTGQNASPIDLSGLASSAAAIGQLFNQNELVKSQVELQKSQARKTDADALNAMSEGTWIPGINEERVRLLRAQSKSTAATEAATWEQADKTHLEKDKVKADTDLSAASAQQIRSQNMLIKDLQSMGPEGKFLGGLIQLFTR